MGRHVVVVGAGAAGLAAALRLAGAGLRVTLLERDGAAGGRAREGGAHGPAAAPRLVGGDDGAVARLVADAAERARARAAEPAHGPLLRPAGLARWRDGALEPLQGARGRWGGLGRALALARIERIERRFAHLLDRDAPERAERLDDRSVAAMARLYLPRGALAREVAPLCAGLGVGEPEDASRVLYLLWRRPLAGRVWAARGFAELLAHAAAGCAELRCGTAAEALEAAGAEVRVRVAGGATFAADAAVVAVPPPSARAVAAPLLTPPERELLSRASAAPAVVLHAALERAPVPRPTRVLPPAEAGLPVAWLDLAPGGTHAPQSGGVATLVAAPAWSRDRLDAPDDALEKELTSLLARLVRGAGGALRLARVERHSGAFPRFPAGRYRELARFRRIQADRRALGRRLYFAGDHLAEPTLEGAVRSGLRAADEALHDLGGAP